MYEIWKPIPDLNGYLVSDRGRVKSLNYRRQGRQVILKQSESNGYNCVNIRGRLYLVRRLVASAFVPNPQMCITRTETPSTIPPTTSNGYITTRTKKEGEKGMAKAELKYGIKECRKCEYFLKCSECSCKGIADNLHDMVKDERRDAIKKFIELIKARYVVDTDSGLYGILSDIAEALLEGD